jgi:peptide/nickel transport system substrate-binding protein
MLTKMKQIGIVTICLVLLSSIMLGCIGRETQKSTAQKSTTQVEQVLTVGSPWDPMTLDPHKSGYIPLRVGITETLVDVDYNIGLIPGLAKSWEVSDDKLTWTFNLREGVNFHDNTPFNAYAMKSSLDRAMKEAALKKVPIDSIYAKDDYTLIITTKEPFAPLPAYLAKGESAPISNSSFNDNGEVIKPVGTGPFKFDSWKVKEEIVVVKNDGYWNDTKSRLDKVIYKAVPNAITRTMMLKGGELDVAQIIPPDAIKQLKSPDVQVSTKSIARVRMIVFNTQKEPFKDMKVRQAVNYGINREDIVKYVLDGVGEPARGLFPPIAFWANKDIEGYPYNIEKAKQLLAEAGWKDTDGDGILERDGIKFNIVLVTYPERAELPPTAEVIQGQLKKLGIVVELKVLQTDAANELRNNGEFDMCLVGRGLLFVPDPDDNMMQDYHSDYTLEKGWGAYGYKNERVDELLEKGRVTFDTGERKKIYDEIQEILVDEAPVAYLNYYVNVDAMKSNVHNYNMHPIEQSFHLETVYIG